MGFLFSLLDNPYVPWILGLGALFVAYRFLADRVRVRLPGASVSREDLLAKILGSGFTAKKLEREVARLKKQDNYLAAGKLLEDAGRLAEAAETYLEGQEHWAAAASYEKLGRAERAAELYLQAGDHKKGAALFTSAGKPARAAALFQEKGNNLEAARLYALAGQWGTAAELYEKSGYPLRAAEAWEKDGKPLKAAENFEKHFMENVSFSTTYSSTAASPDNKSAAQAGRLYEKAGQLDRAVTVYSKGGYHLQAAEALLRLGQPAKAAELFLRAENHEKAAVAFEQAGDAVRAATLRGEQAFKSDRHAEAAAWFVKGRDYLRAAELYESVGMMAEAAGAYEAGESWAAAGERLHPGRPRGPGRRRLREGGRPRDRGLALPEARGRRPRGRPLRPRRPVVQERRGLRAGRRAREGDRPPAAGRPGRREPPRRDRAPRPALHRDRPARAGDGAGEEGGRRRADLRREPRPLLLDGPRPRGGGGAGGGPRALQEDAGRGPAVPRRERAGDAPVGRGPRRRAPPASPAPPAAAPAAAPAPAPAARVPRFIPKEEIARGPLGVVWRGEDTTDGRGVAMRMFPKALLAPAGLLPAVAADLKAAFQVSHPNLVKVIAFMEWKGERCLVTELVAGRNFAEAIASGRRLGFQQVHALGRIVAQVLGFVHEKGLVHGSVQPSNVMVASGVIKLADLGMGRLARTVPASPSYHAPEGGLSKADDLYALSAVMYHLLTGTHPLSQAQGVGLPLPSQLAPGVPEAMDKLLLRGLHPRPELRLASAEDLVRELREMVKIG